MFSTATAPRPSNAAANKTPGWLSQLKSKLRRAVSATENAQSLRFHHDCHADDVFHDVGLSRDDALGIGSHQGDLPYFMQSGFGKR